MTIIDWTQATERRTDTLPAAITGYLRAHEAGDLDAALDYFSDISTVTDEGRTYTGPTAIGDWLATSATQYTHTIELTYAARVDDRHYDAVHHLAGDFPGGVVGLHFRFSLSHDKIISLVIEPSPPTHAWPGGQGTMKRWGGDIGSRIHLARTASQVGRLGSGPAPVFWHGTTSTSACRARCSPPCSSIGD